MKMLLKAAVCILFITSSICANAGNNDSAKMTLKRSIADGKQLFFNGSFGSTKLLNNKPFTCSTCHAGDSESRRWPTLVNAAAVYPKYNSTIKQIVTLGTQIQRCIKGGIGGTPPQHASKELVDMLAYMQFIANGQTIEAGGELLPMPNNAKSNKGAATFNSSCFGCHGTGVAGAPKIGDAQAWEQRIKKTLPVLYINAIGGFKGATGIMPPKGGNAALTDDDVRAAVKYMIKKL
jgi:cytochrome c5